MSCQHSVGASGVRVLVLGLRDVAAALASAGCSARWLDGSFVTDIESPSDYDACWDWQGVDRGLLDPLLLDYSPAGRAAIRRIPRRRTSRRCGAGVGFALRGVLPAHLRRSAEGHRAAQPEGGPVIRNERQYRVTQSERAKLAFKYSARPAPMCPTGSRKPAGTRSPLRSWRWTRPWPTTTHSGSARCRPGRG